MEDTYKNHDFLKRQGWKKYDSPTEPEIEDGVYMNTEQQQRPNPDKRTASSPFNYKIIISTLGLLMLVALMALCAVGILYHYKVVFTEILSEKYKNATDTLVLLEKENSAIQNYQPCKDEWKPLALKYYYFSTEKLNWTQSRDHCLKKGGHLVVITSETEQKFVSSQIRITHWIGLNDLETEGEWMWVNNQPLKETGVMSWYISSEGISEPDNWKKEDPSGENCASLGHGNDYRNK